MTMNYLARKFIKTSLDNSWKTYRLRYNVIIGLGDNLMPYKGQIAF